MRDLKTSLAILREKVVSARMIPSEGTVDLKAKRRGKTRLVIGVTRGRVAVGQRGPRDGKRGAREV